MKARLWGLTVVWGLTVAAVMATSPTARAQQWGQGQPPAGQAAPGPGQYPAPSQPAPSQPYQNQPYQNQPGQNQPYQPYPSSQGGGAEQTLATADREDTGRGLEWVWLDAEIGYGLISPQVISNDGLADGIVLQSKGSGLTYGGALGVRMIALTLGARFRYADFTPWDLWSLDLEAEVHIPLGRVEPFVTLGAGYSRLGAYELRNYIASNLKADDLDIDGYNIRIGGGVDYYFTPRFSAGALVNGELIGLHRAAASLAPSTSPIDPMYGVSGFGLGIGIDASAVLGLHF